MHGLQETNLSLRPKMLSSDPHFSRSWALHREAGFLEGGKIHPFLTSIITSNQRHGV